MYSPHADKIIKYLTEEKGEINYLLIAGIRGQPFKVRKSFELIE